MTPAIVQLRLWPARRFAAAGMAAIVYALATGIPTDLIDTPVFGRSIPVSGWAYPVWIVTSLLAGLLVATELRPGRPLASGALTAVFAVGCPVCNKAAVLLLGVGGAASWFGPLQPVLGGVAVALLAGGLVVRLRALGACAANAPQG